MLNATLLAATFSCNNNDLRPCISWVEDSRIAMEPGGKRTYCSPDSAAMLANGLSTFRKPVGSLCTKFALVTARS